MKKNESEQKKEVDIEQNISLNARALINFKKDFYQSEKLEQYHYSTLSYNETSKEITKKYH